MQSVASACRAAIPRAVVATLVMTVVAVSSDYSPLKAHSGSHFAAGEPGNAKRKSRTIVIVAREQGRRMLFEPARIEVRQGEQIRFVIRNEGTWDHEFLLDSFEGNAKHKAIMEKHPEMVHDDPNGKTVGVSQDNEILWRFTKTGTFEYACLMPGHYEAGMKGVVVVTPTRRGRRAQ